jgi:thiol-disulfide isomerase/thioredoxin
MNSQQRRTARSTRNQPPPRKVPWVAVVVGLVVIGAVVIVLATHKSSGDKGSTSTAASAAVVSKVTSLPASLIASVGLGTATPPKAITAPALTKDGKPLVVYFGAEYCPFCAAERWPLVVALSRFGTWSNLSQTVSGAAPEPYPLTPTFSFVGASYSSPYLAFQGVETQTNQKKNGKYTPLQTPTAAQAAIDAKYGSGSVPFIDFGNKYTSEGASYSSDPLVGKSFDEIAAATADPNSNIGKGVLGTANVMTVAICDMTGGKPSSVCNDPTITKLRSTLNGQKS